MNKLSILIIIIVLFSCKKKHIKNNSDFDSKKDSNFNISKKDTLFLSFYPNMEHKDFLDQCNIEEKRNNVSDIYWSYYSGYCFTSIDTSSGKKPIDFSRNSKSTIFSINTDEYSVFLESIEPKNNFKYILDLYKQKYGKYLDTTLLGNNCKYFNDSSKIITIDFTYKQKKVSGKYVTDNYLRIKYWSLSTLKKAIYDYNKKIDDEKKQKKLDSIKNANKISRKEQSLKII